MFISNKYIFFTIAMASAFTTQAMERRRPWREVQPREIKEVLHLMVDQEYKVVSVGKDKDLILNPDEMIGVEIDKLDAFSGIDRADLAELKNLIKNSVHSEKAQLDLCHKCPGQQGRIMFKVRPFVGQKEGVLFNVRCIRKMHRNSSE